MFGKKLIKLEVTDSTNRYAGDLLKEGYVEEGTVISAAFQSAGQGQTGNRWESEKNSNILISLVLHPDFLPAAEMFLMNLFSSLAVRDFFLKIIPGMDFRIKWPNDIVVSDRKIGGILISNQVGNETISTSVVGIGLNINQEKFPGSILKATSLKQLTSLDFNLDECLDSLIDSLENRYMQLQKKQYNLLWKDYHSSLYKLGEKTEFVDDKGRYFTGKIADVGNDGRLCIIENSKKLFFYFKEIRFAGW